MPKANVYNMKGEKQRELDLPEAVFSVETELSIIQEIVVAFEANQRQQFAHTKDRGDVRGGGKKPWRQKGTGRARHGSIRSPLWVGGGVTFGPRNNRNFKKKVNKKVARKALKMVLSDRAAHGVVSLIDTFDLKEGKTKTCAQLIKSVGAEKAKRVLFVTHGVNKDVVRCARNLPNTSVTTAADLNAYTAIKNKAIVLEEGCLELLVKRLSK